MLKERKPSVPNVALRQARAEKSWSQQQVAALLGTSTFTVCRWECGFAIPSPHYRQKLCELFDKSPRELGLLPSHPPHLDDAPAAPSFYTNYAVREKPVYVGVQPPEHNLTGRESLLATLKARLCAPKRPILAALWGLPGVGKTALASELTHDDEVRTHFPDGIIWAKLGQFPDVLALLQTWAQALGLAARDTESISALGQALTTAIGDRRFLFVIDDAWDLHAAQALKVGGWRCCHVLTTRLPSLALQFAHEGAIGVPTLQLEESLLLLAKFVPTLINQAKEQVTKLAQMVGGLPLALVLMGHYLQTQAFSGHPRRIQKALASLREATTRVYLAEQSNCAEYLPSQTTNLPRSLQTVIAPSIQILDETTQKLLRMLANCFSQYEPFSEAAVLAVCDMPEEMLTERLDMLLDAGLLASDTSGCYTIHPTIADYLRLQEPKSHVIPGLPPRLEIGARLHPGAYLTL